MNNHKNSNSFFWGALLGTVFGMLIAPAPGKETRKKLKETSEELAKKGKQAYEDVSKVAENVKDATEPLIKEVEEKVVPVLAKVREASGPVKEKVIDKIVDFIDTIEESAETNQPKLENYKEKIKQRFFKGVKK